MAQAIYTSKKTYEQINSLIIHLESLRNSGKSIYQMHTLSMTLSIEKMCYTLKIALSAKVNITVNVCVCTCVWCVYVVGLCKINQ